MMLNEPVLGKKYFRTQEYKLFMSSNTLNYPQDILKKPNQHANTRKDVNAINFL